jgi:hypothetical protein
MPVGEGPIGAFWGQLSYRAMAKVFHRPIWIRNNREALAIRRQIASGNPLEALAEYTTI